MERVWAVCGWPRSLLAFALPVWHGWGARALMGCGAWGGARSYIHASPRLRLPLTPATGARITSHPIHVPASATSSTQARVVPHADADMGGGPCRHGRGEGRTAKRCAVRSWMRGRERALPQPPPHPSRLAHACTRRSVFFGPVAARSSH
ncbi:hypothetical protein B0H14DRAFT_2691718, partial [Mycena olivaceomarginata]